MTEQRSVRHQKGLCCVVLSSKPTIHQPSRSRSLKLFVAVQASVCRCIVRLSSLSQLGWITTKAIAVSLFKFVCWWFYFPGDNLVICKCGVALPS